MRERRYPPTPYPPHSPETAAYRDGWDVGWQHRGLGVVWCREFLRHARRDERETEASPWVVGWVDGVIARSRAIERAAPAERAARRAEYEARRAKWREEGRAEKPY